MLEFFFWNDPEEFRRKRKKREKVFSVSQIPCVVNSGKYGRSSTVAHRVTTFSNKLNCERTLSRTDTYVRSREYRIPCTGRISSRGTNFNLVPFRDATHRARCTAGCAPGDAQTRHPARISYVVDYFLFVAPQPPCPISRRYLFFYYFTTFHQVYFILLPSTYSHCCIFKRF